MPQAQQKDSGIKIVKEGTDFIIGTQRFPENTETCFRSASNKGLFVLDIL